MQLKVLLERVVMFIFFVCFQESFCFTFKVVSVFKIPHHEIRFHVSCVQALLNSSWANVMSVIYFNGSGAAQLYCRKTRHNSDIHHGTLVASVPQFWDQYCDEYIAFWEGRQFPPPRGYELFYQDTIKYNGRFNKLPPLTVVMLVLNDKWI